MSGGAAVVLVTAPSMEVAERLVTDVVEQRLATCGSIVAGVRSIYRWEGALERADEVMIVFKTMAPAVERLTARVEQLHPYDVPEVLAVAVATGSRPYMDWIASNTDV